MLPAVRAPFFVALVGVTLFGTRATPRETGHSLLDLVGQMRSVMQVDQVQCAVDLLQSSGTKILAVTPV